MTSFPSGLKTSEFTVEWDSIYIAQNNWYPNYGWHVTVDGIGIGEGIWYTSWSFDNIPEPTRELHKFKWWYLADGSEFNTWNVSTWEIIKIYAKWDCEEGYENKWWECIKKSSWRSWRSDGWKQWSTADEKDEDNTTDKNQKTTNNWDSTKKTTNWYTREMDDAYQFAHENWITTTNSIEKAKMNSPLTRIAMAKMLSYYAINVLWQTPDISRWIPKFNDVSNKLNREYDNAVTLSYQLGIMWINMWNKFRPNDEVSRAEFATALSRMLYNTEDGKWNNKYYEPHISKLYDEGIINKTNPNIKETRWYVMIMLMRSAEQ